MYFAQAMKERGGFARFTPAALVLALAGAVLGLGLAYAGVDLFNKAIAGTNPPFFIDIRLDSISVLFAGALVLLSDREMWLPAGRFEPSVDLRQLRAVLGLPSSSSVSPSWT